MRFIDKAWYRSFQMGMNIGSRALYWRKPILVSGEGSSKNIAPLLKGHDVSRVMVVTGRHVGKSLAPAILESLKAAGIEYYHFSEVEANPSTTTVFKIREAYRDNYCNGFLAIGGGSPMDAAKAAAARLARPDKPLSQLAGLLKVRRRIPPLIAVPTTAGTGSETTIAAVVTGSDHHKYAISDLCLIPRYAILDPALTVGLPPHITAETGMDALTHAVEAYLSRFYNTKQTRLLAENAVVAIFTHLERAYHDGASLPDRAAMLQASFDAGAAFTRASVGNVHAIAHTLGGLYGVPHGLANAVLLPLVLEDYGKAAYPRLARLAALVGLKGESDESLAKAFIAEIRAMNTRMGIPDRFNCIREEDIPLMATWAAQEANPVYPVPVIYDEARFARVIERSHHSQ